VAKKGRLLDERAVAEPRHCLSPIWAADDLHATRTYSAKRASKQSTSYILKKASCSANLDSSEVQPSLRDSLCKALSTDKSLTP
jgi:hypothetical protein